MIEIIVMIAVVRAFIRLAKQKGLNKTRWGIIGALSYYGPILICSIFILPVLFQMGILPADTTAFLGISVVINLILGVACCFAAYQYLKRLNTEPATTDNDILDHFR